MAQKKKSFVGKIVKFLGAQPGKTFSNFNAPIGSDLRITGNRMNCGLTGFNVVCDGYGSGFVYEYEVSGLAFTAEELRTEITKKEAEIAELKAKLSFIEKFGLEDYDEDEFKAYSVLETLGLADISKARAIVSILSK